MEREETVSLRVETFLETPSETGDARLGLGEEVGVLFVSVYVYGDLVDKPGGCCSHARRPRDRYSPSTGIAAMTSCPYD
ncbi:hypothetical protein RRG08_007867 [Elysia crispata]|uniref:Uncharacterized protein n=1 Tax=Elysia crispata TaxID=231223 RepID=A0AAE0XWN9_9GAST|nr:hypothetical protein RRG08_007867 [Elysia crispata]